MLGQLDTAEALLRELNRTNTAPDLEMAEVLAMGASQFVPEKLSKFHQAFIALIQTASPSQDRYLELNSVAELASQYLEFGHKGEAVELLELAEQRWSTLPPELRLSVLRRLAVAWHRAGKPGWGQEQLKALHRTGVDFSDSDMMFLVATIGDSIPECVADLGRRKNPRLFAELAKIQSWRQFAPPPAWIKNLHDPVNRAYALNGWAEGIRPNFPVS
jgi:hypothetical protein